MTVVASVGLARTPSPPPSAAKAARARTRSRATAVMPRTIICRDPCRLAVLDHGNHGCPSPISNLFGFGRWCGWGGGGAHWGGWGAAGGGAGVGWVPDGRDGRVSVLHKPNPGNGHQRRSGTAVYPGHHAGHNCVFTCTGRTRRAGRPAERRPCERPSHPTAAAEPRAPVIQHARAHQKMIQTRVTAHDSSRVRGLRRARRRRRCQRSTSQSVPPATAACLF